MSTELEALVDSLRRFLLKSWPIGQSSVLNSSSSERTKIWRGLCELGLSGLGAPDTGGVSAALPVIRELGAAHCSAPIGECVAFNAVLHEVDSPWLVPALAGVLVPAFSPGKYAGVRNLGSSTVSGARLQGNASLVDGIGATHLALLGNSGELACLIWTPVNQPDTEASSQSAYLESSLNHYAFNQAACQVFELSSERAISAALLWRFLLTVRATGALEKALASLIDYAQQRKQFGKPVGSFQAIQHKLANIHIAVDGARLMQSAAAEAFDRQQADWCMQADTAIATADPALRHCMLEVHHAFGAIGYSEEHSTPRHFRRVHIDLARVSGDFSRGHLSDALKTLSGNEIPAPDLGTTAENFRRTVQQWLTVNWTEEEQRAEINRPSAERGMSKPFSARLGLAGWIGLTWPKQYGGQERSRFEQLVLAQELSRVSAPTQAHIAAANLIAPALLAFGTDEQKKSFLPRIARGELTICLGYSESESGSDLASLQTRAERTDDGFVINGQKMWGTLTDKADYVWLAARTDPSVAPHAGISIFLVSMTSPGITVRPGMALYGKTFSSQHYDNVAVPRDALIGELNQGWTILTSALADERILMGSLVTQVSATASRIARRLLDAAVVADLEKNRLGGLIADVVVANEFLIRSVKLVAAGAPSQIEAAITKIFTSELMERVGEMAIDLLGPQSVLTQGSIDAQMDGDMERLLRTGPMQVIGGGTNEIQRTLIAQRGLGLPRR